MDGQVVLPDFDDKLRSAKAPERLFKAKKATRRQTVFILRKDTTN